MGKKTRIQCLLRALYGNGIESLRLEEHQFETPSRKKVDITTIGSNFHVQVNPRSVARTEQWQTERMPNRFSDVGIYDRVVIQELIKTIAQTRQINQNEQRAFKGMTMRVKRSLDVFDRNGDSDSAG